MRAALSLEGIMNLLFARPDPGGKGVAGCDMVVDCLVYSILYFFFKMLFTTRTLETSLSVEVNTSTFHTCEERPL